MLWKRKKGKTSSFWTSPVSRHLPIFLFYAKVLKEVSTIKPKQTEEEKHFVEQTGKLYDFVLKADNVLDKMTEYKDNWLAKLVVKIMK